MLHLRQGFRSLYHALQTFIVKLVRGSASSPSAKHSSYRNAVIFFRDILMNRIIGEAGKRALSAVKKYFDFIGGRMPFYAIENVGSFGFIKHSAVSTQHSARQSVELDLSRKRGKHSFHFDNAVIEIAIVAFIHKLKIVCLQKMIFKLARRTGSNIQISLKLAISSFATSLGDVCRDRSGTSPNLAAHAIHFLFWKFICNFIRSQC